MSNWHIFPNRELLDRELAQRIAVHLKRDIEQRGTASLALSGGSTPKGMFQQLSRCELDWRKVDIVLVDERWVAPDSAESNERLLRENLLQNSAMFAHLHSLKTVHAHPREGLAELNLRLAKISRPFSVVVLGMGGDGHTASWFPRANNLSQLLDAAGTDELAATDPVTAPQPRVTLTFPAVLNAHSVIIHIAGDDKKAVLEGAVAAGVPIAAVLEQTKTPVSIWWAP